MKKLCIPKTVSSLKSPVPDVDNTLCQIQKQQKH